MEYNIQEKAEIAAYRKSEHAVDLSIAAEAAVAIGGGLCLAFGVATGVAEAVVLLAAGALVVSGIADAIHSEYDKPKSLRPNF